MCTRRICILFFLSLSHFTYLISLIVSRNFPVSCSCVSISKSINSDVLTHLLSKFLFPFLLLPHFFFTNLFIHPSHICVTVLQHCASPKIEKWHRNCPHVHYVLNINIVCLHLIMIVLHNSVPYSLPSH